MKELIETFGSDELQIELICISEDAYFEMRPRIPIRQPFPAIFYWNKKIELAPFYWAMLQQFGGPTVLEDRVCYPHPFYFRLNVRKNNIASLYSLKIDFRKNSFDPGFFKYTGADLSKKENDVYQDAFDEFSLEDMVNCLNYIGGRCQGYLNSGGKPDFYYRTTPELQLIWGAQNGSFFEECYSGIGEPPLEIAKDDKRVEQWRNDQNEENEKAYQNRIDDLSAIASKAHTSELSRDDEIDYPGYSKTEIALIRRGEARCQFRQLQLRFGADALLYMRDLESATSSQLARWSEALIDARTINEVFVSTTRDV